MSSPVELFGRKLSRRDFITAGAVLGTGMYFGKNWWDNIPNDHGWRERVFIGKAADYDRPLARLIRDGFKTLGVTSAELIGKRILLKPNLVESHEGRPQISTHPLLVRAAIEAFLGMGAAEVLVAEGPGHERDTMRVLQLNGLAGVLREDRIRYFDLNYLETCSVTNAGGLVKAAKFELPRILQAVDWVVSMPKMKTHHWMGVTLSMKNMFGVMPGCYYGWPKNVLHHWGIADAILDLNLTVKPQFSIVDGIVGMEGDGPILGGAKACGVVVMGRNAPAVDATAARIMKINPHRISYLKRSTGWLGPVSEHMIQQVGEKISTVATPFQLLDRIPAHHGIRL